MADQIDMFEIEMENMTNRVNVCKEQADAIRKDVSEYEQGVIEMREMSNKIDKINQPKKRWWHFLVKPEQAKFTFEIEGRPVFTEQELAERRAFLDGYDEGRKDGDSHKAYKLWRKMIQHSDK